VSNLIFLFFPQGVPVKTHKDVLQNNPPHILVGTPGRILGLVRGKDLKLDKIKHFVVDECDRVLEALGELVWISLFLLYHALLVRYAKGCTGNFPRNSTRQASDDVLGHAQRSNPSGLQEILPRCKQHIHNKAEAYIVIIPEAPTNSASIWGML
jgi:hypothetical protein